MYSHKVTDETINSLSINMLSNRLKNTKLEYAEKEKTPLKKETVVLDLVSNREQMDKPLRFGGKICDKLIVSKSNIEKHRIALIEDASETLLNKSKIADTINIDGAERVHIGHVINITEQIILNAEENQLQPKNEKRKIFTNFFYMIDRMHWLAQPSVSTINCLKSPAEYVIICHTATEEAFTQAENVLMLRLLQTFHIESQGWADVAYNFCVGSDGNVYEGRGWFMEGSHTQSYNRYSVGISFIGCFLDHLPPATSLKKCRELIDHGVQIGAINPEYELVGHCQCRPFLSPGACLFKEIQSWEHFNPDIKNTSPCKLSTK